MIAQIKVVIDADGNVTIEGSGFKGNACDRAMKEIEASLGIEIHRVNKPEYNSIAEVKAGQNVGGSYPKGRWP